MTDTSTARPVPERADAAVVETTILIVDDHRSFSDLLCAALNTVPGMRCVGTASSAAEGVAIAMKLKPSVVVMDIQMPQGDGLEATRLLRRLVPDTIIAVVTAHHDPAWVARAAQAGASAFIPKDGSLADMIDVLTRVRSGQMLLAPATFSSLMPHKEKMPKPILPILTSRELEVLTSLSQGQHAKEIARVLGISLHTCRGYIKAIHQKLGVSSQLEAVIKAQNIGLVHSSDDR